MNKISISSIIAKEYEQIISFIENNIPVEEQAKKLSKQYQKKFSVHTYNKIYMKVFSVELLHDKLKKHIELECDPIIKGLQNKISMEKLYNLLKNSHRTYIFGYNRDITLEEILKFSNVLNSTTQVKHNRPKTVHKKEDKQILAPELAHSVKQENIEPDIKETPIIEKNTDSFEYTYNTKDDDVINRNADVDFTDISKHKKEYILNSYVAAFNKPYVIAEKRYFHFNQTMQNKGALDGLLKKGVFVEYDLISMKFMENNYIELYRFLNNKLEKMEETLSMTNDKLKPSIYRGEENSLALVEKYNVELKIIFHG